MLPDHDLPQADHDDPPPLNECCESGCPVCVYDLYAEALEAYRRALSEWERRHPAA